jgi:hypothetical protein
MNQPLKVLLIEDEAWRYHNLLGFPIHLFWARNHHDVDELLRFGPFDLVLWDHDLQSGYVSCHFESSLPIAEWFVKEAPEGWDETAMIVHSWNSNGGVYKLLCVLRERYPKTLRAPFGPYLYSALEALCGPVRTLFEAAPVIPHPSPETEAAE